MNGFELRQANRRVKLAKQRADMAFATTLETVGVQSFFEEAFTRYYGRKPKLVYRTGWFLLQGKRYSREKLKRLALELYAKLHEHETGATQ